MKLTNLHLCATAFLIFLLYVTTHRYIDISAKDVIQVRVDEDKITLSRILSTDAPLNDASESNVCSVLPH